MRHRDYLEGLAELHRVADEAERRALWRQSLADLAAAVADTRRAVPLEGLDPTGLLASVQQAFATGLVDDVEFLSPAAANAALYELAAALPPCELKRELGRRVLRGLTRGDAETFVAVATQLAVSSSHRALASRAARARVALSLDLPLGMASRADGLALALISRRELAREWLTLPSQGALPSRVLASRLLERAAREAARRHAAGDDAGVR
ncbi:MAG: serine/threonine protein kinase, partial [Myxococcota bacterium]